ncbi:MAG: hypothetical protein VW258_10345 [Thalassolituus sp.]
MSFATDTLSERQYRLLESAQEQVAAGEYADAIEATQPASESWDSGLGLALILQLRGQVFQLMDKPEQATGEYQRALLLNVLSGTRRSALASQLAQLYLIENDSARARDVLIPALQAEPGEGLSHASAAYVLVAVSYQMDEQWQESLEWIRQANAREATPPVNWLTLQAAAEFQTQDFDAAERTMLSVVVREPDNRTYWIQLAAAQQLQNKQKAQLATLELAAKRGLLDGSAEERLMIQLQAIKGMPARAARNLAKIVESITPDANDADIELLAALHHQARDYDKAADIRASLAKQGNDSTGYSNAVQLAMMGGNCSKVLALAEENTGLLSGNALLNAGQCAMDKHLDATRWFQRALQQKDTAVIARQWLNYIEALRNAGLR